MNKNLKEKVMLLYSQGFKKADIVKKLGCSRSIVRYYLNPGNKEKSKQRVYKNRKVSILTILSGKLTNYKARESRPEYISKGTYSTEQLIYTKIRDFTGGSMSFSSQDVLNKFGDSPKCYLTGRPIDFFKPRTYQFDHIKPISKQGSNDINNLGIACKAANQAKSNLELSEFIQLCKEVLGNFGYKIQPPLEQLDYCI